jgi:hypothetical protein
MQLALLHEEHLLPAYLEILTSHTALLWRRTAGICFIFVICPLYWHCILGYAHTPFPYCCLLKMFLFGFTVNLFDYTLGVILGEKISHTIQDQM